MLNVAPIFFTTATIIPKIFNPKKSQICSLMSLRLELRLTKIREKKIVVIAAIAIGGCYWKLMKFLVHYENYLISFYILNSSLKTHKGIVSLGIQLRARLLNLLRTARNLQVLCFWKDIERPIWMHLTNKCHLLGLGSLPMWRKAQ